LVFVLVIESALVKNRRYYRKVSFICSIKR